MNHIYKEVESVLERGGKLLISESDKRRVLERRFWTYKSDLEKDLDVFYYLCHHALSGCSKNFYSKLLASLRAACKFFSSEVGSVDNCVLRWILEYLLNKTAERAKLEEEKRNKN